MVCLQTTLHYSHTITMVNEMKQKFIILFVLLFSFGACYAQSGDSIYTLTAYGGFGYVRNISSFNYELPGLNKNGLIGNLRIMWKPDYLLRAGIEVGRTDLYSVDQPDIQTDSGSTNLKTDVYSWTYMFVFSMSPLNNLDINAGTGWGFNTVNNSLFGNESTSTEVGSVFMVSSAYYYPVSGNLKVGAEIRFMHLPKYDDQIFTLQFSIAYIFLEY